MMTGQWLKSHSSCFHTFNKDEKELVWRCGGTLRRHAPVTWLWSDEQASGELKYHPGMLGLYYQSLMQKLYEFLNGNWEFFIEISAKESTGQSFLAWIHFKRLISRESIGYFLYLLLLYTKVILIYKWFHGSFFKLVN